MGIQLSPRNVSATLPTDFTARHRMDHQVKELVTRALALPKGLSSAPALLPVILQSYLLAKAANKGSNIPIPMIIKK